MPSVSRGHHRQLKRGCDLSTSLTRHRHVFDASTKPRSELATWLMARVAVPDLGTPSPAARAKDVLGDVEDIRNGLSRLSGSRRKNAHPLRKGHKFSQRLNLHFLHH